MCYTLSAPQPPQPPQPPQCSNRFVTLLVRSCEEWTSLAGDPQPVESRGEEESGGCVHGGAMNSSPSAWPSSLQHITVRSSTPLQGARGQAPGPERVRCSSRAKPQGDRTHLSRESGQHRCWRCGRRGNLSGTRGSSSSWYLTPSCRRWRYSWWKSLDPRPQCSRLPRRWWSILHPRQQ